MAEAVTKLPIKTEGQKPEPSAGEWRPLANLRREIDRLFDDFGWGIARRPAGRTLFDVEPFWRGELSFGKAPAVDDFSGILLQSLDSISVEALPADMPSHVEVDISVLSQLDSSVHVKDLVLDPKPPEPRIREVLDKYPFRDVKQAYRNLMSLGEENIRFLYQEELEDEGFVVELAKSGEEAIPS